MQRNERLCRVGLAITLLIIIYICKVLTEPEGTPLCSCRTWWHTAAV